MRLSDGDPGIKSGAVIVPLVGDCTQEEDPKAETIDLRFMICEKPAVSMSRILTSRSDAASHPADSMQYLLVDTKNGRDGFDENGRISVGRLFAT